MHSQHCALTLGRQKKSGPRAQCGRVVRFYVQEARTRAPQGWQSLEGPASDTVVL
jgi:hypothetical protein